MSNEGDTKDTKDTGNSDDSSTSNSGDSGSDQSLQSMEEGWKRLGDMIDEKVRTGVKEELNKWQPPGQTQGGGQGQAKAPVQTRRSAPEIKAPRIESLLFPGTPLRESRRGSGRQGNKDSK